MQDWILYAANLKKTVLLQVVVVGNPVQNVLEMEVLPEKLLTYSLTSQSDKVR